MPILQASYPFILNPQDESPTAVVIRLGPSRPAVILNAASQKDRRKAQLFPLLMNATGAPFLNIGPLSCCLALLHSGDAPAKQSESRRRPQRQHPGDAVSVGVAPPPQSSRRSTYAGRWRRMLHPGGAAAVGCSILGAPPHPGGAAAASQSRANLLGWQAAKLSFEAAPSGVAAQA